VRTDVKRKRLAGIHPNETLAIEGYSAEMTERTYAAFFDEAASAIRAGQCAVLDAVFAMPDQRAQAEALAETLGVSFTGVWVSAPEEVRVSRVIARERNVSDVTADIARGQSDYDIGAVTWAVVDSSGSKEDTIAQGLAVLGVTR
jgi:predicted kinase